MLHGVELCGHLGVGGLVLLVPREPFRAQTGTTSAHLLLETLLDAFGYEERFFRRPVVELLGQRDLFETKRFAMSRTGVLLVG